MPGLLVPADPPPAGPEWLCCPTCRGDLRFGPDGGAACDHGALQLADALLTFLPRDLTAANAILAWPSLFVERLAAWAAHDDGEDLVTPDLRGQLEEHGLLLADGSLTTLGMDLKYHLLEQRWQADRTALDGLLKIEDFPSPRRVLDVGCGAGQTLRLLNSDRRAELVGVDQDLAALALGYRLSQVGRVPIRLAGASAYALPIREASFDLVVTRVALNYMHQGRALAEMVRVLRPGGFLFCRVEGVFHDLEVLVRARSLRGLLCRGRDLAYGLVHSSLGWQPTPGSLFGGGRAFATRRRLGRILESLGCCVLASIQTGPLVLGRHKQLSVLAQRGRS